MTVSRRFALLAATTFGIVTIAPAVAQDEVDHSRLTIGVGGGYMTSYEGSDDYIFTPVGAAQGQLHDFAFWTRGTSIFIDAIPNRDPNAWEIELGPVANVRRDRTTRIKDTRVRALGKLNTGYEVGGFAGIGKTGLITSAYDSFSARVSYLKDVSSSGHGSYVITPAIEYATPLSKTTLVGVSASADYVGKGYGRYYFDIDSAGSSASTLPTYSRAGDKAGFKSLNFNLTAGKSLSGDLRHGFAIFALGGYSKVLGRYADSPVVAIAGDRDQWMAAVGIGYTF